MKVINQVKFALENMEKIVLSCESDCSLGHLYDFSVALHSYVCQAMKEASEKQVFQPDTEMQEKKKEEQGEQDG